MIATNHRVALGRGAGRPGRLGHGRSLADGRQVTGHRGQVISGLCREDQGRTFLMLVQRQPASRRVLAERLERPVPVLIRDA